MTSEDLRQRVRELAAKLEAQPRAPGQTLKSLNARRPNIISKAWPTPTTTQRVCCVTLPDSWTGREPRS